MFAQNGIHNRNLRIRVPASTANLGAAFDAVGLALQLYLKLEMHELGEGPSRLEFIGEDAHLIPTDESNLIWRTMSEIAEESGCRLPYFAIRAENEIPITKGLGSSASARLAAAAAVNFFCNLNWESEKLLEIAVALEGHPDNVAPSLYGGLVASISDDKILCSKSDFPSDWTAVTVTPDFELETELARSVLPSQVPRKDAIYNVQRTAFLMAQLVQGKREGLREAMSDRLHQPYRSELLPGLKEVLDMEYCEGLLGVALSGAGSTVVAFADSNEAAVGARIADIFKSHGLKSQTRFLKADNTGLVLETM
jgi:homoserine kinase